jgi:hypothetical protein
MSSRLHAPPLRRLIISLLGVFLGTEIMCRFLLGLGDPPLVIRDDNCGYRFLPNQNVWRFGNQISYDEASSRGGIPKTSGGKTWMTLVLGDSVVDGLALTDDADTLTGILNEAVIDRTGHRLVFRALAAGSWGTPQQLGYLKAYGMLGANAVVLILNSGDTVTPAERTDPVYPTIKPWTATEELVMRYALRCRGHLLVPSERGSIAHAANVPPEIARSADGTAVGAWCLEEILRLGRQGTVPMAILVWPGRDEAAHGSWGREVDVMREVAERNSFSLILLMDKVREQPGFERRLYRDGIHPSEAGNRLIAGAILETTQALYDERIGSAGPEQAVGP